MRNLTTVAVIWASLHVMAAAQIQPAADAPLALPSAEAERSFKLPPGFRMELLASEPLVHEPSGVCWDERGRLYACELHGYNLDGHYDVEELNKTGQLDHVVRSGNNSSNWSATQVSPDAPENWTTVTVDLWNDLGEFTLTGIAPTAMGGPALFDRIELLRTLDH